MCVNPAFQCTNKIAYLKLATFLNNLLTSVSLGKQDLHCLYIYEKTTSNQLSNFRVSKAIKLHFEGKDTGPG